MPPEALDALGGVQSVDVDDDGHVVQGLAADAGRQPGDAVLRGGGAHGLGDVGPPAALGVRQPALRQQ